ncbi:MAG: hypothetical protein FJX75_19865 [Armatimonadetes bacterium]|nr:hypothetical protein [Armatimonadota bacterium]
MLAGALILPLLAPVGAPPPGVYSAGNVDGVLTWSLGNLDPGASARHVLLFAFDDSPDALVTRLDNARGRFANPPEPSPLDLSSPAAEKAWIANEATDFALERTGYFSWRSVQQALRCDRGGQLSQYSYYVHWRDSGGEHRAGNPYHDDETPDNLQVIQPMRTATATEAWGLAGTADGKLRLRVRAMVGEGSCIAVEYLLTNLSNERLEDLRFSAYANLEAAHDHENDLSLLDSDLGGLLVIDPPTGRAVTLAGLTRPVTGWSATWNSLAVLQAAQGVPFAEWPSYRNRPPDLEKQLARARLEAAAPPGIYLPFVYDNPTTPETRTLSPDEAEAVLERDWLFQAEGKPLADRAQEELAWTLALANRLTPLLGEGVWAPLSRRSPLLKEGGQGGRIRDLSLRLQTRSKDPLDETEARDLYFAVRRLKRDLMFSNPVLDFDQVLFIDQPTPAGPVNPEHEAIHRMGITATPGGRLLVLKGLHPGGEVRQLAPEKPGSFWSPDLSFDAKRLLFCYKAWDEKSFHLYAMNLDGTGLRRLTEGDYDDVDPLYLPDGHILFTTTRGNSYVRCGPFIYSYTLARCDADGSNVYLVSQNGEPDFVPSLMPDGRIIYSRWEYTDRPLWRLQSLWTTNPDGTNTQAFYGNRSVWPDHLSEPRQIPGSRRVMFSGVGHHDWWSGSIGIVDPDRGTNFPDGLTKVTADRPWPECSAPPVDPIEAADYHSSGPFTGYKTAYPLSDEDFLVSARGLDGKFRLYLVDVHGNRELIYEGAHNILHALPIRPRPVPPAIPSTVIWPPPGPGPKPVQPGVFFSADVYDGVPEIPRGMAKYLRVWQQDHKTYSTWRKTYRHSGPAVSIVQEEAVKRIVSVVPVEEDGSVCFTAPAGKSLYFQLLDQDYRCLQTMRSFTGLMPGEKRGCQGCHELHSKTPPGKEGHHTNSADVSRNWYGVPLFPAALHRAPTPPSPPPWGAESISYERFAQPVLDRYCGQCHEGDGEGRKTLDLTLRPGVDVFKEPYLTLIGSAGWGNPVAADRPGYGIAGVLPVESMDPTLNDPRAYGVLSPMQSLSYTSKLIDLAMSGEHYDVRVDPLSLQRLIAWVDACGPFMGEEELRAQGDPDFPGIDLLPIRPRVATAPVVDRP